MSETILMIHGMWTGEWIWDEFKRFFENRGYQCVTPTLRYHNQHDKETPDSRLGTTSLLDYAADLENEINKLNATPIIMGHSMGGLLAQKLGSRGLAKALVLLTPALPAGVSDVTLESITQNGYKSILQKPNWWQEPIRPNFDEAVFLELHLLPPGEQRAVYEKWVYESGRVAVEISASESDPAKAAYVDKSKVNCPVLVAAASQDNALPPFLIKKVADYYEGFSTYKEFENHAHWLIGEPGWEDIAEYICEWLGGKKN